MILHLGGKIIVPAKNVLMILDYRKATDIKTTGVFLGNFAKDAKCTVISKNIQSVVLLESGGSREVYYSPISSATLAKRAEKAICLD